MRNIFCFGKSGLFLCVLSTMLVSNSGFCFSLFAEAPAQTVNVQKTDKNEQLKMVEARLTELKNKKARVDESALIAERDGDRLLFQDYLTAQMFYRRQERLQAQSHALQKEIEALLQKKEELEKAKK
jgi:hypothetical protein